MKKCSNCQTEFDGDVCPNCQTTAEIKKERDVAEVEQTAKTESTVAEVESTNKTESSAPEVKSENKSFKDKIRGFVDKYYAKLKLVPPITFLAYMVLTALFLFLCPVAVVKVAGAKYGTVFSGKNFNEIPGLNNVTTILLIVALASFFFTLAYVIFRFFTLRFARVKKVRVSFILEIISAVFVLLFFVLACIVAGVINVADKGITLVTVGAYPILSIILSIFALLLIVPTVVACFLYEKQHPELIVEFDKKGEEAKEKFKKWKKKEITPRQKISGIIAGIICFASIFVMLGSSGYFKFDKSFSAKKLQTYVLKNNGEIDSIREISKVIGDSYVAIDDDGKNESNVVTYYTSNFVKYKRKYERYSKYTEKAMEKGNMDDLVDWMNYELQLEMDKENMTYGEANISYNKGNVESIIYTVHSPKSSKKLISTKVMKCVESNADEDKKEIDYIVFMATYSDGSFVYAKVKDVYVKLLEGTTVSKYEGSYKDYKIVWSFGGENYEYGTTTSSYHTIHSYATEWSHDETHHYHKCTIANCEKVEDKEEHTFVDYVCECGYEDPDKPDSQS